MQQLFAECCSAFATALRLECDLVRELVEPPDLCVQFIDQRLRCVPWLGTEILVGLGEYVVRTLMDLGQ